MGVEEIDYEEYARRYAPNRYLLDTSIVIWVIAEPQRLSKVASAIWHDPDRMVAVSVINCWEIALKKDHKDPFDRMLVAQARVENMPLVVTSDKLIQAYDVRTAW